MSKIENTQIDSLFKARAKQSLLTQIAELQVSISHGWGENIITEASLDSRIKRVRYLCEEYVSAGLFTQEEMDEFWVFVNQSRRILRTRHSVEKLTQDLAKNKHNIPKETQVLIEDVIKNVGKFRYPKDGLLKVKEQESVNESD